MFDGQEKMQNPHLKSKHQITAKGDLLSLFAQGFSASLEPQYTNGFMAIHNVEEGGVQKRINDSAAALSQFQQNIIIDIEEPTHEHHPAQRSSFLLPKNWQQRTKQNNVTRLYQMRVPPFVYKGGNSVSATPRFANAYSRGGSTQSVTGPTTMEGGG